MMSGDLRPLAGSPTQEQEKTFPRTVITRTWKGLNVRTNGYVKPKRSLLIWSASLSRLLHLSASHIQRIRYRIVVGW
jgi:hypothetical protein